MAEPCSKSIYFCVLYVLLISSSQGQVQPQFAIVNQSLSIVSNDDVLFEIYDGNGQPVVNSSIMSVLDTLDNQQSSLNQLSSDLQATSAVANAASVAVSSLQTDTLPSMATSASSTTAQLQSVLTDLAASTAVASTAVGTTKSMTTDLYSITSTLTSNLATATTNAGGVSASVAALPATIQAVVGSANALSNAIAALVSSDSTLSFALTSLGSQLSGSIATTDSNLRVALNSGTSTLASSTAVHTGRLDSLSAAIVTSLANAAGLSNQVQTDGSNIIAVSAAQTTLALSISATVAQVSTSLASTTSMARDLNVIGSSLSSALDASIVSDRSLANTVSTTRASLSAAVAYTDSVSSAVSTRVGVDASLAASNILLGNTLSAQIVTVTNNLQGQITTATAALAASTATQTSRVDSLSAGRVTDLSNTAGLSTQVRTDGVNIIAVSTAQTALTLSVSAAVVNLANNVYARTTSDQLLSAATASLSAGTVAQVSTLNAAVSQALALRLVTSQLLATLNTGLTIMNTAAPNPNNAGLPASYVMWLDAMNYQSAVYNNLNAWLDLGPFPSTRAWSWTGLTGGAFRQDGAYIFNGNGYFTNTACNGFLPFGTTTRTLAVWARPEASSTYLRHIFHYGTANTGQAWGMAVMTNGAVPVLSGLSQHQWGATDTVYNWNFGEAAFMVMTLESGNYFFSKNGAAKVQFGSGRNPSTAYSGGSNKCNVGSRVDTDEYFSGKISAVYMYSRALSNAEINALYTQTLRTF